MSVSILLCPSARCSASRGMPLSAMLVANVWRNAWACTRGVVAACAPATDGNPRSVPEWLAETSSTEIDEDDVMRERSGPLETDVVAQSGDGFLRDLHQTLSLALARPDCEDALTQLASARRRFRSSLIRIPPSFRSQTIARSR